MRSECEDLLTSGEVAPGQGWEQVLRDGDRIRVWRRKSAGTAFEYALRGKTANPAHVFFRTAFVDIERRMKWDESCGEARMLQRCDATGVETLYWVTKYPWPVAERDYVFHRVVSSSKDEHHATSWVGPSPIAQLGDFKKPSKEDLDLVPKHRVRVLDYRTSMLVRSTMDGGALWALRVLDDPCVAVVPTSVVNWIASKTLPSSVQKLDKACDNANVKDNVKSG